ncbi:MAG: isoleucine--tRNA ligase [Deltaproteobacteria bacterium]|nr:isoleucine--tRNA ligase [Deltaproteobacteria bacterium]
MDYKATLNLPKTGFPMKANLAGREPARLDKWESEGLYAKVLEHGKDRVEFILHDGPPYANGNIHIGTALNKILKDIIIRSKRMQGFYVRYIPGWDCHGLPIEHNVDKKLGSKKKNMTPVEIRGKCREYAGRFVDIQRNEFKRLGVMGEWDNPYLTMSFDYEAVIAQQCMKFALDGSLFRSRKPIYWCSSCKTALAEAEIEYGDESSPSVYVRFPLADPPESLDPKLSGRQVSFVIWTTTPWTLPANLAIALHPDFTYAAVAVGDNKVFIIARELVEQCMEIFGIKDFEVIAEMGAKSLEKKHCHHPFIDRKSLIVLGDHVTLETGTGCVHTAPGHGREDYETGLAYGLEAYSPVNENGCLTKDAGEFAGMFVFKADGPIIERLKKDNMLLFAGDLKHSYAHCWRCKKPVIFRATPQWFISMDKTGLREKALTAIDEVKWIPSWGRDRIYNMILNRPDWCVSRQRSWGVPITVFYCRDCGELLINEATADRIYELFNEHGADIWFEKDASFFLPEDTKCSSCGCSEFKKESDILDVWFDSGVSHAAVLNGRMGVDGPADMYLEGSDQHRGWFHSSLLTSIATKGAAPYKSVLTHGFVVDGNGRKMSKSVGNVIAPKKVIDRFGAEILRLWVSASDYRDDIRISDNILKQLSDAYRRIRNTCRFMLGNLYDFNPAEDALDPAMLSDMDRFMLHRLGGLVKKCVEAYDSYEFHTIYHSLYNYCTIDLSAIYLDIIKDRLYTSPPGSSARRGAQTVMYETVCVIVNLMAPILPFTAEEIWSFLPDDERRPESIYFSDFPKPDAFAIDVALAKKWDRLLEIRGEVTRALETARGSKSIGHSLDAGITIAASGPDMEILRQYESDLRAFFIVSKVDLTASDKADDNFIQTGIEGINLCIGPAIGEKCPRCWVYDPKVGQGPGQQPICSRCQKALDEITKNV